MQYDFKFSVPFHSAMAIAIGLIFVLTMVGCGDPNVGTVSGKATYQDKPLPTGTKVFFERSGTGYVAAAQVDETGAFQLKKKGSTSIPIGEYTVYVGPPESNLSQSEFYKLKRKVDAEFRKNGKKPPPSPDWVLPENYYSPNSSPLRQSVIAGPNEIKLVLED